MFGLEDANMRELCFYAFVALFGSGFLLSIYTANFHQADQPRVYRKHYLSRHEKLDLLTDKGRQLAGFSRRLWILSIIPLIGFMMLPAGAS